MNFRFDINSLRAIAVISVVIFHYKPSYLPGGFSGVDVFFVISGYLMTKLIFSRLESGNFSISNFYKSRAVRISPPLNMLCMFLIIYGFFTLPPIEYNSLGKHISSSLLYVSNFVYWGEVDYFDEAARGKWLLHTWSLSVEWQFYIVFPASLVLLSKIVSIKSLKLTLILLTLISFLLSSISINYWPSASYYLLPTRAWEMLIGGVAYLYPISAKEKIRNTTFIIGLSLILFSILSFSKSYPWPGYMALFPVVGTYLCICSNVQVNAFTRNKIVNYVGRSSYSIYLWHWPILLILSKDNNNVSLLEYITLVLVVSSASFFLIEKRTSSNRVTLYTSIFLITFSFSLLYTQGLKNRVDEIYWLSKKEFHSKYYGGAGYKANKIIFINSNRNNYDYMMIGDSYGLQYIKSLEEREMKISGLFDHGCMILPNYTRYLDGKEDISCSIEYDKVKDELKHNNKPLIMSHSWDRYSLELMKKGGKEVLDISFEEYLNIILLDLEELFFDFGSDRKYIIIGVPHRANQHAFNCMASQQLNPFSSNLKCEDTQDRYNILVNSYLSRLSKKYDNVFFIDPEDALCDDKKCVVIKNDEPIHTDQSHLSVFGSEIVVRHILTKLDSYN